MSFGPNPTTGKFGIQLSSQEIDDKPFNVKIFDLCGRKIFESIETGYHFEIDISSSPKGLYTLQVADSEKNLFKKIVLN